METTKTSWLNKKPEYCADYNQINKYIFISLIDTELEFFVFVFEILVL